MKVAISYPPLEGAGVPLLGQNRQFQWFANPTYIYPVVPAYAATMLNEQGSEVLWDDAIAEGLSYHAWLERVKRERPGLVAIETKTPVVKRHWRIIDDLKALPAPPLVALMGDHATALPSESMEMSRADFVVTGGDYDFQLSALVHALSKASEKALPPGVWYRSEDGQVRNTGRFRADNDLRRLPQINRRLTRWELYSQRNGNFKNLPGAYTMAGRDCWWGRCSFCSWTSIYPEFRLRSPESLLDEIGSLIEEHGVREVMDDTGTFPKGEWLRRFCAGMIERGYNRRVTIGCNMRFGAIGRDDLRLMKKAGFRLLLFGLESASQRTLDLLNKGVKVERAAETCKEAREAGLYPHVTIMFGYPWETLAEAEETLRLGRWLLKKGYAWTVQATVVIPYPGTPLFDYCRERAVLSTLDWDRYDMSGPVVRTQYGAEEARRLVQKLYSTALSPGFIARRLLSMRDLDDLLYFARAAHKVLGHFFDFGRKAQTA